VLECSFGLLKLGHNVWQEHLTSHTSDLARSRLPSLRYVGPNVTADNHVFYASQGGFCLDKSARHERSFDQGVVVTASESMIIILGHYATC
jgi:hypothetical protein